MTVLLVTVLLVTVLLLTVLLLTVLLLTVLSGCVGPSRTLGDYQLKAGNTAKAVLLSVGTARLVVQAAARGQTPGPYASVALTKSEQDAAAVQATFDSYQPPDARADLLRAELDDLLTRTADVLTALRIAVRRGQLDRLPQLAEPLEGLADRLGQVQQAYR